MMLCRNRLKDIGLQCHKKSNTDMKDELPTPIEVELKPKNLFQIMEDVRAEQQELAQAPAEFQLPRCCFQSAVE